MKKIIVLFVLIICSCLTLSGQKTKSYVTVYVSLFSEPVVSTDYYVVLLSGDIPYGMKQRYTLYDLGLSKGYKDNVHFYYGKVLNMLAEHGFVVEYMTQSNDAIYNSSVYLNFLLSKPVETPST